MTNNHSKDAVETIHFALSHATGMANQGSLCCRNDEQEAVLLYWQPLSQEHNVECSFYTKFHIAWQQQLLWSNRMGL